MTYKFCINCWIILILFTTQNVYGEPQEEKNYVNGNEGRKVALIFGITGQDGAYLTEFLLEKNYIVHGVKRRSSSPNTQRLDQFYRDYYSTLPKDQRRFFLHYGDVTDSNAVSNIIQKIQPDEIYNLAAQSHVQVSFQIPKYTTEVNSFGPLYIVEAIRSLGLSHKTKFYQASTSEMFGKVQEIPQTEKTPFYPRSTYAVAKLHAYWTIVHYREAHQIFACNGILFNHESPFRAENFVTRKITLGACRQYFGLEDILYLGNLDAKRDWGYAKDYVEAMWMILQQDQPADFVIATGETHSVREFVELTYKELGIEIEWIGSGSEECGIDKKSGRILVQVDPKYYRPTEVDFLLGNSEKAERMLHWKAKTNLNELIKIMVDADLKKAKQEARLLLSDEKS